MNILVSGVAGDIGFGAGRILKKWGIFERIYGIDIKNDHPGNVIFNKCKICPSANSKNYLQWIEKFILDYSIHLFIPTSEAEILFFANSNIKNT